MELIEGIITAKKIYSGSESVADLTQGQNVRTKARGNDILLIDVPHGKIWNVNFWVEIHEVDA